MLYQQPQASGSASHRVPTPTEFRKPTIGVSGGVTKEFNKQMAGEKPIDSFRLGDDALTAGIRLRLRQWAAAIFGSGDGPSNIRSGSRRI